MKQYLLGIDIGTSACKVAIYNRKGEVLSSSTGDYPVYYPKAGYAEQNPDEWWTAVCEAIKKALQSSEIQPEEIAGIGVDGQSWSAIAMDSEGQVLTNTPIWMDTRAKDICDRLNEEVGSHNIFKLTGNSLQPSYSTVNFTASSKLSYMPTPTPARIAAPKVVAVSEEGTRIGFPVISDFI